MTEAQRKVDSARIRPGDRVLLAGWPPVHLEVVDVSDPALLVVRGPNGGTFKVGRRVVAAVTPKPNEERST